MLLINNCKESQLREKELEIFSYSAWHGLLMGLESEDLLRGKETFSYLLRAGEGRFHYYLSYVLESPFIYKHQPFAIVLEDVKIGLGFRNGHTWWAEKIENLIPLIIHQPAEKCIPILNKFKFS
jgi:hypothetical protein